MRLLPHALTVVLLIGASQADARPLGTRLPSGPAGPAPIQAAFQSGTLFCGGTRFSGKLGYQAPKHHHKRPGAHRGGGKHKHGEHGHHWKKKGLAYLQTDPSHDPLPPRPPQITFELAFAKSDVIGGRAYRSSWMERCEAKFASFDAQSGTYVAADGTVKRCR